LIKYFLKYYKTPTKKFKSEEQARKRRRGQDTHKYEFSQADLCQGLISSSPSFCLCFPLQLHFLLVISSLQSLLIYRLLCLSNFNHQPYFVFVFLRLLPLGCPLCCCFGPRLPPSLHCQERRIAGSLSSPSAGVNAFDSAPALIASGWLSYRLARFSRRKMVSTPIVQNYALCCYFLF